MRQHLIPETTDLHYEVLAIKKSHAVKTNPQILTAEILTDPKSAVETIARANNNETMKCV